MASNRSGGGGGGFFGKLLSGFLVAIIVVTFLRIPTHDSIEGTMDTFRGKAETIRVWAEDFSSSFDISALFDGRAAGKERGVTPPKTKVDANESQKKVDSITTGEAEKITYNRDEWKHWIAAGSSCWNVREEVLYKQAVGGSVKFADAQKKATNSKSQACSITAGKWVDPYTGKTFTNPSDIDIDHMIPLKYAATHGGNNWTSSKKQKYANSMDTGHLLAVSASANRSKSDKGPGSWKPTDKGYWCQYASHWINVSVTWKLTASKADKSALTEMLKTC